MSNANANKPPPAVEAFFKSVNALAAIEFRSSDEIARTQAANTLDEISKLAPDIERSVYVVRSQQKAAAEKDANGG